MQFACAEALFAAFEHKAGKISIVNRNLENDLSEAQVTVVRTLSPTGRGLTRGPVRWDQSSVSQCSKNPVCSSRMA